MRSGHAGGWCNNSAAAQAARLLEPSAKPGPADPAPLCSAAVPPANHPQFVALTGKPVRQCLLCATALSHRSRCIRRRGAPHPPCLSPCLQRQPRCCLMRGAPASTLKPGSSWRRACARSRPLSWRHQRPHPLPERQLRWLPSLVVGARRRRQRRERAWLQRGPAACADTTSRRRRALQRPPSRQSPLACPLCRAASARLPLPAAARAWVRRRTALLQTSLPT